MEFSNKDLNTYSDLIIEKYQEVIELAVKQSKLMGLGTVPTQKILTATVSNLALGYALAKHEENAEN